MNPKPVSKENLGSAQLSAPGAIQNEFPNNSFSAPNFFPCPSQFFKQAHLVQAEAQQTYKRQAQG